MRGTVVTDTFARTVAGGWGSADTGQAWTTLGAGGSVLASDWNVSAGVGTHSVPVATAYRMSYLAAFSRAYVDVAVTGSIAAVPTGGAIELANLAVRGTSTTSYSLLRVQVETSAAVTALIFAPGGAQLGSVTVPAMTYTAGLQLRVRAQAVGRVYRMKVWKVADPEPVAWVLSVLDATYTGAGWIGIRSGVALGNTNAKPVVVTYDNFASVLLPDFPNDALPLTVLAAFGADLSADPSTWPWKNITADVRAGSVSINPGRGDETSQASPASCSFQLLNDSMAYSAGNPASANHPNVKRNTPIWVLVDPATRFFGYANGFTPSWDISGKLPVVSVSASGVLRRLMQGKSALASPMRHAITAANPVAYWPMEDKSGSSQIASALPGKVRMDLYGTINFAAESNLPGSEPVVTLTATTGLWGPVSHSFNGHWQVDWHMRVPAIPAPETILTRTHTTGGTVTYWDVVLGTSGVPYQAVYGYNSAGTRILDSGTFTVPSWWTEQWIHLRLMARQNGGNVDWQFVEFPIVGSGSFLSGSFAGTLGDVVGVQQFSNTPGLDGLSQGHLTVYDDYNFSSTDQAATGYTGETVTARLTRLCAEQGVPITITGTSTTTMGPQAIATFVNNLRECEAADLGLLFDGFGPGLGYITRKVRENQAAALTLDMAADPPQVAAPFGPVDDDQRNRNLWKVERKGGSNATYEDATGPLGTDPLTGIGTYDASVSVNVATDGVLPDFASWLVHQGTIPGLRYPALNLDLAAVPALFDDWIGARLNSRIDVTNVSGKATGHSPGTVSVIDEGYTETLRPRSYNVAANCSPARPWEVFQVEDSRLGRVDTQGSTLQTGVGAGATSLSVQTTTGPVWATTAARPADFPFDIDVGSGWQVTVTAITGATSPQTFTVAATPAALSTGATVGLWRPSAYAL